MTEEDRWLDALLTLRRTYLGPAAHLDREIEAAARSNALEPALFALLGSKEFRKAYPGLFSGIEYDYRLARIDCEADPDTLNALFARVAEVWTKLGTIDSAWSVLSSESYRKAAGPLAPSFHQSGESEAKRVVGSLTRNGMAPPFRTAVEYGCGMARVSVPLARYCGHLYAYDISSSHLELGQERANAQCATNISFELVLRPDHPLRSNYDLYYSHLVFQHNPPPIIAMLVRQALCGLAPGGVAVFQLLVFRKGYSFRLKHYLMEPGGGIEMHVLPQRVVLDIIRDCECHLLDVFETSVNLRDRILSNTFTVQKPKESRKPC